MAARGRDTLGVKPTTFFAIRFFISLPIEVMRLHVFFYRQDCPTFINYNKYFFILLIN